MLSSLELLFASLASVSYITMWERILRYDSHVGQLKKMTLKFEKLGENLIDLSMKLYLFLLAYTTWHSHFQ